MHCVAFYQRKSKSLSDDSTAYYNYFDSNTRSDIVFQLSPFDLQFAAVKYIFIFASLFLARVIHNLYVVEEGLRGLTAPPSR